MCPSIVGTHLPCSTWFFGHANVRLCRFSIHLSLANSILPRPLVRCLEQHPNLLSLQRIGAWSLFNLLDGQPRPTVDVATVNMVNTVRVFLYVSNHSYSSSPSSVVHKCLTPLLTDEVVLCCYFPVLSENFGCRV